MGVQSNVGICRACGETIFWYDRADGGRIPLQATGESGWVIIDNIAHATYMWDRHICDPQKAEEYLASAAERQREKEKRREVLREQWQRENDACRAETWKVAITFPCPECDAAIGARCMNLARRANGVEVETKNPHHSRLPAAWWEKAEREGGQ